MLRGLPCSENDILHALQSAFTLQCHFLLRGIVNIVQNWYYTIMINNKLSYRLPVIITKQNRRFVAYTPALDISTSGKTEKEVKERFEELVNIFFEEIIKANTVNDILSELGWKKVQRVWTPPQVVSSPFINMKIPALS